MAEIPGFSKARGMFGGAKDVVGTGAGSAFDAAKSASPKVDTRVEEMKTQRKQRADRKAASKKPDRYEQAVMDYNDAYTALTDTGTRLLNQRERAVDLIDLVESLVNSIARTPKAFDTDVAVIRAHKQDFSALVEFAKMELATVRKGAVGAGAGVAAGASVAAIAPTAAMWVATTFGTASTGAAISSLSGAAATNAAIAWLGGGAAAAGGGGMSAGAALLALAGPVGWSIAGATILTSVVVITAKKFRTRKKKEKILSEVKQNTAAAQRMTTEVSSLLEQTEGMRTRLIASYESTLSSFEKDYAMLDKDEQRRLTALVNNTKACAALLSVRFEELDAHESDGEPVDDPDDE